ncbi:MAG: hypothetical protein JSS82_08225 [Bacteroidetes bacterium]|nr:hypothetical protein [Bacteroidota bacterium]
MEKEFDQEVNPEYLSGFNQGYALAQYAPEIGTHIATLLKDTERGNGFLAGREQFQSEKSKERIPEWLRENAPDIYKDHDLDKELEKDDYDHEPPE